MESPRQDIVIVHSFEVVSKLKAGHPGLAGIELRLQKLHNRLIILLKSQEYRKKAEEKNNWITNEVIKEESEDDNEPSELETIQKEMMELQLLKDELEGNGASRYFLVNRDHIEAVAVVREEPRIGVYTLPPPESSQEAEAAAAAASLTGPIVPVESLGKTAQITKCPSCEEVVLTEIQSKAGESVWIMCLLCSMLGCIAGCCLIPFRMKRLRNISHRCPQCQAQIHVFRPL